MLKSICRVVIVVTAFSAPCASFAAQPSVGMPAPVLKNVGGIPAPDPVFKNGKNSGGLTTPVLKNVGGIPAPDPVFKNGKNGN